MMRLIGLTFAALLTLAGASAADEVDLELVLAMDASGSISRADYILQLEGTAAAFRDPEVQAAMTSGALGKIAVAVMLWSDAERDKPNSGWFIIEDAASAEAFAAMVSRFQLPDGQVISLFGGGGTGIGAGVEEALRLLSTNAHRGDRQVIDVSGDGVETEFAFSKGVMIRDARAMAEISGVTVNGLPISRAEETGLGAYYRDNVITGPGAFVIEAKGFDDFARAFREKLLREVALQVAGDGRAHRSGIREAAVRQKLSHVNRHLND